MSKLSQILKILLGVGEAVVPIFIHNAQSQRIEGIVLTTANAATDAIGEVMNPGNSTAPAPPAVE